MNEPTTLDLGANPNAGPPLDAARSFDTLTLTRDPNNSRVARITFNRPARLNAIGSTTPGEIRDAVAIANDVDDVHVIVLQGAGRAFCAGYDIEEFADFSQIEFRISFAMIYHFSEDRMGHVLAHSHINEKFRKASDVPRLFKCISR